jgi:UDP-N-acetylglucosamine 2-epimerase (non-hydrolysing)
MAAIAGAVEHLLDDAAEYSRRAAVCNPYGDGRASQRIAAAIMEYFSRRPDV